MLLRRGTADVSDEYSSWSPAYAIIRYDREQARAPRRASGVGRSCECHRIVGATLVREHAGDETRMGELPEGPR